FPDQFSFSLTDRPLKAPQYLTHLRDELNSVRDTASEPDNAPIWSARSTIEIRVNGLDQPRYVYSVIRKGVVEYAPNRGAYDAPEVEYTYTRFDCALVELQ